MWEGRKGRERKDGRSLRWYDGRACSGTGRRCGPRCSSLEAIVSSRRELRTLTGKWRGASSAAAVVKRENSGLRGALRGRQARTLHEGWVEGHGADADTHLGAGKACEGYVGRIGRDEWAKMEPGGGACRSLSSAPRTLPRLLDGGRGAL